MAHAVWWNVERLCFKVRNQYGVAEIVMPSLRAGANDILIKTFEAADGSRWGADDANPQRRYRNTLTLTQVRGLLSGMYEAIAARLGEAAKLYERDRMLREIYNEATEAKLLERAEALRAWFAENPDPQSWIEDGSDLPTLVRNADVDYPDLVINPFASQEYDRRDRNEPYDRAKLEARAAYYRARLAWVVLGYGAEPAQQVAA